MRLLSWIIFLLLVMVEGVMTTVPLTLIFLLCLTVMKRQEWIFVPAFIAGILLDTFAFRPIGISSIFFVSFMFLLLLYQRKYETATLPFVVIAAFVGSMLYLLLIGQPTYLLQAVLSTIIAAIAFSVYRIMAKPGASEGFQRV